MLNSGSRLKKHIITRIRNSPQRDNYNSAGHPWNNDKKKKRLQGRDDNPPAIADRCCFIRCERFTRSLLASAVFCPESLLRSQLKMMQ